MACFRGWVLRVWDGRLLGCPGQGGPKEGQSQTGSVPEWVDGQEMIEMMSLENQSREESGSTKVETRRSGSDLLESLAYGIDKEQSGGVWM